MTVTDNKIKAQNGSSCRQTTLSVIKELQNEKLIKCCYSDYRCGYPDMSDDQFFAPFVIEFFDNTMWLLFSTNSIRSDRASIQQWNAENISRINPLVKKSYFVIPAYTKNNKKEYDIAKNYDEKIRSGTYYTAIDGVLFTDEVVSLIKLIKNNGQ